MRDSAERRHSYTPMTRFNAWFWRSMDPANFGTHAIALEVIDRTPATFLKSASKRRTSELPEDMKIDSYVEREGWFEVS